MSFVGERQFIPQNEDLVVRIAPPPENRFPDLFEVVRFREVLYFLARKNLALRYKQTFVGIFWVVLQPLSMMLVFTLFFGQILKLDSEGLPFAVFAYSALIAWNYFSSTVTEAVQSVSGNRELIKKVYFPRLILPFTPVLTHLVDFACSLVLLLVLMAYYGIAPRWEILALPGFLLLLVLFATGIGVWLSALNVRYRDIPYAIPFLLQLTFFMSPVLYSASVLEDRWRAIYQANPLAAVIEGFRWSLVGGDIHVVPLFGSVFVAVGLLLSGLRHFGSTERDFASQA